MKSALAFDTLLYANKLKDAGMEPHLAEVQAEVTSEILSDMVINMVASKQDVIDSENRLRAEIKDVDNRLSGEINEIKHMIESLQSALIIKLGGMIFAGLTALVILMKIFHL